jgi:branched-chain amino acid transport system substrate-binding protein
VNFRLATLAALCLGLCACGGGSGHSPRHDTAPSPGPHRFRPPTEVDVYSSLPLHGPLSGEAQAIEAGIRVALSEVGSRAGLLRINYTPLDDSTAASHGWNSDRTLANAMRAASDRKAVYYIGELDSAASEFSIPVLNQAGIAQVSPANTYIGLTQQISQAPGATRPGEPDHFYPDPKARNFLRIIPADNVQAAAAIQALKNGGCKHIAIAYDNTQYGSSLAALLHATAQHLYGFAVTSPTKIDASQSTLRTYAEQLRTEGADCLTFAGVVSAAAIDLVKEVHLVLPTMRILGTDGVCSGAWTNPRLGGVSPADDPFMYCTRPVLPLKSYPGGTAFLSLYQSLYGLHADPNPYAIFGYEAMQLALDTIAELGIDGANRGAVRDTLFATRDRPSILGTYGFTSSGDTTLTSYGLYMVGPGGDPKFDKSMNPPRCLGLPCE